MNDINSNPNSSEMERQRFATATIGILFLIVAILTGILFYMDEMPDKLVAAGLLLPMAVAFFLVRQNKIDLAVWVYSTGFIAGEIYLVAVNPQSPKELDVLLGRFIFPVLATLPVVWFALDTLKKKLVLTSIILFVVISGGFVANKLDTSGNSTSNPMLLIILYIMLAVTAIGIVILVVRTFPVLARLYLNQSIQGKLTIAFGILMFFTLVIAGTMFGVDRYKSNALENLQAAENQTKDLNHIQIELLGMRWREKDFLLSYEQEGFQQAYQNYVLANQQHADNVLQISAQLMEAIPTNTSTNLEDIGNLNLLQETVYTYNDIFADVVANIQSRGTVESGLFSDLNFAIVDLVAYMESDEYPAQLQRDANELLKIFSEYNISGDAANLDQFRDQIDTISSLLSSSKLAIPVANRQEIKTKLDSTLSLFEQLVYLDIIIAKDVAALPEQFEKVNQIATTIENNGADNADAALTNYQSVQTTMNYVVLVVIAISITFGSVVGVTIMNSISRPVHSLTTMAEKFAAGELDVRVDVETSDEIGHLATSFNTMADEVGSLMTNLEQHNVKMEKTLKELEIRSAEMEASQRVTFAASERATPEDLLNLVVNLIRDQFNLYHAQVYILDDTKQNAVLQDSTGYAGRMLLQRKHHISMETNSLVIQAIKTEAPVLVAETTVDPNWLPNELLPDTKSELVVPLVVGDEVIGALDIQSREPAYFSEHSIPLFQQMTNQVAFLFENAALLGKVSEQTNVLSDFTKQLRTAAEIAGHLNTITDMDRLLEEAVNQIQLRFGFYHAHIYLFDPNTEQLVVQAGSGHVGMKLKRNKHTIPLNREASLVARSARDLSPVVVEDVHKAEGWMPNPLLPDTRSEVAIPLVSGERLLGVLDMQDAEVGRFTQADVDTLSTMAGQMASSIISAELFHDVEVRARRTNLRYEITQALSGDLTKDQVLDGLVKMANQFPKAQLGLSLVHDQGEELIFEVVRTATYDSGLPPASPGDRFKPSEFPVLSILEPDPSQPIIANNISEDERFDPGMKAYFAKMGVASLGAVPIALAGQWYGLLRLGSKEEGYFDQEKIYLYQVIAEQGALALEAAQLRAAQRDAESRFRALFENVPLGFVLTDLDTGVIIEANKAFSDMIGYSPAELNELPASDLSPEAWADVDKMVRDQLGRIGNFGPVEKEYIRKDGTVFPVRLRGVAVAGSGGKNYAWSSVEDITSSKAARDAIVQGDKLKSEFLANMSHELRTPLNSIVGYTDVLLMGIDGDLNDEMQLDIESIQENSNTLLTIINDILDLAKIEAGRIILELSQVDTKDVMEDVIRNNSSLLHNKPVSFELDVEKELPTITADSGRVKQILNNLVSNAVKFTNEGSITLRGYTEGADWVVLEVEDTGKGIHEKDLQVIFEEFRQADGSQTRTAEGTGLGLTITRRLVHMHGGEISVRSEFGKGSTFTIKFPLETRVDPSVAIKVVSGTNGKDGKNGANGKEEVEEVLA